MQIYGKFVEEIQKDSVTGTGYFVLLLPKEQKRITVVGAVPVLFKRASYRLTGFYGNDGIFYLEKIRRWTESTEEAVGAIINGIPGFPRELAEVIVHKFGVDIFGYEDVYNTLSTDLRTINRLGTKRVEALLDFLHRGEEENKLFYFLSELNIPYECILSYMRESKSLDTLMNNPYILMLHGASFPLCDKIAVKYGMDPWNFKRIQALTRSSIKQMEQNGHTRMELSMFLSRTATYSRLRGKSTIGIPEELLELSIYSDPSLKVYEDDDKVYVSLKERFLQEQSIVEHLQRLMNHAKSWTGDLDPIIQDVEHFNRIRYNKEQRTVFQILKVGGIAILLGGPGTGKTTTINGLVQAYINLHPSNRVLLCAPTGRAASRMAEVSGRTAMTMHKSMSLKWFNKNDTIVEPLPYDLIIADEMSMCDTELFATFISAAVSGTTILLTGDYEQLPSVGPGQVFRDLVESGALPVYRLTEPIRQKEGSRIISNAKAVLQGWELQTGADFVIQTVESDEAILRMIRSSGIQADTQYMTPVRKGPAGTDALNRIIQDSFKFTDPGIYIDGLRLHEGDRIIMNQNNYPCDYMNGDVGIIRTISNSTLEIQFADKTLQLSASECNGMSLAYILTVHKSQGAECDCVHLILSSESNIMASKELLYTAITRARKKVVITAVRGILENFLSAENKGIRECGLFRMLKAKEKEEIAA